MIPASRDTTPRNLVICCDGTGNQFGPENTSVVRLARVLDQEPSRQLLYYDPGVGTLPEPGVVIFKHLWSFLALAFGIDLGWKVREAYSYLMDMWEPGDRVYLFGFSRGAYTVRVLAGMLHALGLLPRGNANLVPYAFRLFKGARRERRHEEAMAGKKPQKKPDWWDLCSEFRRTFSRPIRDNDSDRRFPVHFAGIWDTVSAVGWVWNPKSYYYTENNPSIGIIRHAVSLDERRAFFRQNLMKPAGNQDFMELWFPGVHADVGGGYREEDGGLWRGPFTWILDEARKAGLHVDLRRLDAVLDKPPPSPRPWLDQKHESLTWYWWPAEFVPKVGVSKSHKRRLRLNLGRHRYVPVGACLHQSTLLRIREMAYSPANLSAAFLDKVRASAQVPDWLPYEP